MTSHTNILITIVVCGIYGALPFSIAFHSFCLVILLSYFLFNFRVYTNNFNLNALQLGYLGLFFFSLVGLLWSEGSGEQMLDTFAKYSKFFYLVVISIYLSRDGKLSRVAIYSLMISTIVVVLTSFTNIWWILPWSKSGQSGFGENLIVMNDHIIQGLFTNILVVFSVSRLFSLERKSIKIFWLLVTLLSVFSVLFLMKGRTGLLTLFGGGIFVALYLMKKKLAHLRVLIAISSLLLIAAYISPIMSDRIVEAGVELTNYSDGQGSSIGHRLYNIKLSSSIMMDAPFFGFGTGSYSAKMCEYIPRDIICAVYNRHPHNQFLLFGVEFGLVGISLFVLIIYVFYLSILRYEDRPMGVFAAGFLGVFLADSFINSSLYSGYEAQVFCYVFAFFASFSKCADDKFILTGKKSYA